MSSVSAMTSRLGCRCNRRRDEIADRVIAGIAQGLYQGFRLVEMAHPVMAPMHDMNGDVPQSGGRAFWIDRAPVTNRQPRDFVRVPVMLLSRRSVSVCVRPRG